MIDDISPKDKATNARKLLDNSRRTLASLDSQIGLSAESIRLTSELMQKVVLASEKLEALEAKCYEPDNQGGPSARYTVQRYEQTEGQQRESALQAAASQRELDLAKESGIEGDIRVASSSLEQHRSAAQLATNRLARLRPQYDEAQATLDVIDRQVNEKFRESRPEFEHLHAEAEMLNSEVCDLFTVVHDRPLAEKGATQVRADSTAFGNARDYHREQAGRVLWGLLALVAIGAASIWWLYSQKSDGSGGKSDDFVHIITVLGGRVTAVALVAWLVYFLGKLHAAHSQQAVTYQDRMAGLAAAEVIINYGLRESKEEVLRTMARAYLTLEGNAFAPITKPDSLPFRQVRRLTGEVTKLVQAARVEGAASARKIGS